MSRNLYAVEAITGKRVVGGKEKYQVKWLGYPESESTWEPIENLTQCLDDVIQFNQRQAQKKDVIDQIIGCGERDGQKYFLVRFRGSSTNKLIDWDTAKQYSLDVMEFFGARLSWNPIDTIIDPENEEIIDDTGENSNDNRPSTSKQHTQTAPPNEIEYDD